MKSGKSMALEPRATEARLGNIPLKGLIGCLEVFSGPDTFSTCWHHCAVSGPSGMPGHLSGQAAEEEYRTVEPRIPC